MESNTPKTARKSSLNTIPTHTNATHTPSDVRCVTQSQVSVPSTTTPDSGPDHQHILNSLCAAEQTDNTPKWQSPQASLAITPVIPSPDRATIQDNVAADLFQATTEKKRMKDRGRKFGAVKATKKRPYCNPSKGILWFLRDRFVEDYVKTMKSKTLSTAQRYKPAYAFWSKDTNSATVRNAYYPFEDMKSSLSNGWPLSKLYRRLLLEDFMLLEPDDAVVCFMSKNHPLMKSKTWVCQLKEVMRIKPYEPLTLKSKVYFGFDLKVASNIYRSDIINGIFSKKELAQNCTMRGGYGLTMELSNYHLQLFTYHTFMSDCDSLLFYSRNLSSRIPQIQKVITNVKDSTRIGPTAMRFLDEVIGDTDQYISVLHNHDSKLKTNLRALEDKAMKEAELSTSRVIKAFTLENNNPAFLKVRAEIDTVMSESVQDIYGEFSELTTPILNQVRTMFPYNRFQSPSIHQRCCSLSLFKSIHRISYHIYPISSRWKCLCIIPY